jgi:hypothetical protein
LPQLRQPLPGEVDDDELGHMADQAVFNGHLTDRPASPNYKGDPKKRVRRRSTCPTGGFLQPLPDVQVWFLG